MRPCPPYHLLARAWAVAVFCLSLAGDISGESLGGVKVNDSPQKVEQVLGKADVVGKIGHSPEMGGEVWVMGYKTRDLRVWVLIPDQDKTARVMAVSALGKSTAKTAKGIGLGATREEVGRAYGPLTRMDGDTSLVPGEGGNALAFTFKEDRVIRVVLGRVPGFQ